MNSAWDPLKNARMQTNVVSKLIVSSRFVTKKYLHLRIALNWTTNVNNIFTYNIEDLT